MFNRRKFIKTSAIAAAGAIVMPPSYMNLIKSTQDIKNVGLQLWSIPKSLEQDFTGTLEMISKIGYKEVELYGPYPFSSEKDITGWKSTASLVGFSQSGFFNNTTKQFKEILDSYGLTTPAMHVGLDTLRNKLNETAEAAHILGQQYVGIASIPTDERHTLDDYKRMGDEFNVIGEKVKALGLRFYYHNHGYGLKVMEGRIPLDVILEVTDPSLVYFEMDVFWTTAGGADPIKYLDQNPGRYKLLHVKDMTKQVHFSGDGGNSKQWIELFPFIADAGEGILDLKTILSHAQKSGVEHFIVENDAITNPKDSLEKGFNYLHSIKLSDK